MDFKLVDADNHYYEAEDAFLRYADWPHPEGNIQPADYASCLNKLPADDIKRIMRDNALSLLSPP